ncbi:MAG: hypothetical protein IJW91_04485 [Phascolarctobacterium sp.]|nr:hypothetical protein [Phascolarctobacterium sp.]MBQ7760413.1 hypothetical protein [Acidaminococcaceae bacterium]MBQ7884452.1 hypothetical protein [Phascolarctobacterium sp.]
MKKLFLLAAMVMMLAISSVCSAANGKMLSAEEKLVNDFLNAKNYGAVTSFMTDNMKKSMTADTYANFKEQVDKNFGKLTMRKLRIVQKFDDADVLVYQAIFEKVPAAEYSFVFMIQDGKPMLEKFSLALPPKPQAEAAPAK